MLTWRFDGQFCLKYPEDNVRFHTVLKHPYPCILEDGAVCRHLRFIKDGKIACDFAEVE